MNNNIKWQYVNVLLESFHLNITPHDFIHTVKSQWCMCYIRHNMQCQLICICHWLNQMFINLLQLVQMSINSIHLEGACNHLEEYVTAVTG